MGFLFFFPLYDFVFLSPFQPVPFPLHKKKEKKQKTQIKYLSGTIPLAQAASVCFVLPPSLPGLPRIRTLGPQLHDSSPHLRCLHSSHSSASSSAFIASLHHDHKQLWAVSPCGASTDLPDLIVPAVGPLQRVPKVKKSFGHFAPSFTVNMIWNCVYQLDQALVTGLGAGTADPLQSRVERWD